VGNVRRPAAPVAGSRLRTGRGLIARASTASTGTLPAIVVAVLPLAAAIAVFGMIYGASAAPELGAAMTLASSLLVFSGTLQFATLGLLASGAGPAAVLLTAVALNARHVVLGAVLRPRLSGGLAVRAGLAWFLVDETFGLSYAAAGRATLTLLVSGVACYAAWQLGTAVGLLGARIEALEGVATAVFPVLFIGLAAVTSTRRALALRAGVAALVVLVASLLIPEARTFAPVLAAVVVALPGERRPGERRP
jgi:predicted branched-subunit amino acid permease